MASFGSLAPGMGDENDLLSSPQYTYGLPSSTPPQPDWREQEAQAGMAAEREAARPSGLSTMWSAIKHPSLYPMISGMMGAEEAPKPPITRTDLPDVGPPLISPGPQISSGTRLGRAISGQLPEAVGGAIESGLTAPHRAVTGQIPMFGPTGGTSEEMVQAGSDLAALAGGASVAGTLERAASSPGLASGELKGQKLTASQLVGAAKRKGLATYHMDIPDSLRRELLTKPMSLFEDSGEAGKAAAVARQIEQQRTVAAAQTKPDRVAASKLTEPEYNLSVHDIQHPSTPAAKPSSRNVEDIAADLDKRGQTALKKLGSRTGKIEESDPKFDEHVARTMASEIKGAMDRGEASGKETALDWYRGKVENAMKIAEDIHPELKDDPHQRMAYKLALSITSQGEKVRPNTRLADQVYEQFKKTGRFPTNVNAQKPIPVNGNFKKINDLLDRLGPEGTRQFLDQEFTVRDLKKMGYNVSGENVDTKVRGSTILGSKIGGGFYQNLNGNFDPVTMDLWFMRGWGRLTGTLVGNPEAMPAATDRLRAAFKAAGKRAPLDQDKLADMAEEARLAHERDYRENRKLYDSGKKKKSELALASEAYLNNYSGINDQQCGGSHREWIRKVVNRARDILEQEHSVRMSNADMQATWRYPEKELYSKL